MSRSLPAFLFFVVSCFCLQAADRPNVILIVTDDQGYGDMACHGNPWLQTPNIDQLHREGVRLEDFHTDPVCTPTRAALMTGRYSTRVGAWAVTEGRQLLNADEKTMADAFAGSGYRTGMFGKWHLGDTYPFAPQYRGFQDVVCHRAGGIDEIGNPDGNSYFDDTLFRNGVPEKIDGYCTDVFFDETIRFVAESRAQPFFVYLPLNAMHGPFTVAPEYSQRFTDSGHPERAAKFMGMVENFDDNLGRLLATLREQGIDEDTMIIFMGDNGTALGNHPTYVDGGYNAGLRARKGSVFEGGHKNACFVRWPGKLEAGLEVEELTSVHDWLPTLIEICDLTPFADIAFDGDSIAPLLRNETTHTVWRERILFIERQADTPSPAPVKPAPDWKGRYPIYAVLTEKWRLAQGELFDIAKDPEQKRDLATEYPAVVEELHSAYLDYYADAFSHRAKLTPFLVGNTRENPTQFNVRDWHPVVGNVIWKKEQLGDDKIVINGFWGIDVQHAGTYRVRLSRHPDDAPAPMNAVHARAKIGDRSFERVVSPIAKDVTFEIDLPKGVQTLQTWLTDPNGTKRGAYFVEFERI